MGIDISGWVEVREGGSWQSVVTVWPLLARNYYMYKFVLGAWKEPGKTSIVEPRGIPPDVSAPLREEYALAKAAEESTNALRHAQLAQNPTAIDHHEYDIRAGWVTWNEIASFDWERADNLLYAYEPDSREAWRGHRTVRYHQSLSTIAGISYDDVESGRHIWQEGQEWVVDGNVLRVEKIRRGDPRIRDWELLFGLMELLSASYGGDNVRLVAWFEY